MNDWEKKQAENERNRKIEERARQDREAGRNAQGGFGSHTYDHGRYTDVYNKS